MAIEAVLPQHKVVPSWTLTDLNGQPWSLFRPRGRAHTLLVVAAPGIAIVGYLSEFAPHLAELEALPARGVAVVPATLEPAALAWTILPDPAGTVRSVYLTGDARAGVFILDRYNDLYRQWLAATERELPPVVDVLEWLEAVAYQCGV